MHTRRLNFSALAVAVIFLAAAASAQDVVKKGDNLVEVTVTGQGTSKADAERDARAAGWLWSARPA